MLQMCQAIMAGFVENAVEWTLEWLLMRHFGFQQDQLWAVASIAIHTSHRPLKRPLPLGSSLSSPVGCSLPLVRLGIETALRVML